ncbi:MAG: F0F1 ATP synthase subunit delta [Deltaproteobacteria bacterium]|nr:F0F1 ATP synthase subunit delta [Deltaproteobacteria bacterium]
MSSSRIAKRYAKALFSLGQEEGRFEQYGMELKEFADLCREHPEFGAAVANPVFAAEDRKNLLLAVLDKSGFSGTVQRFLRLLLDKGRMGAVEEIAEVYEKLWDEAANVARARIVTARPLKEGALKALESSLAELTSKKIRSDVDEDPSLIGGVVVKIGDVVLDGSVKAQLEGLKESLKRGGID